MPSWIVLRALDPGPSNGVTVGEIPYMSSLLLRREQERAHYQTKAQLTKAFLGLNDASRETGSEDKTVSVVLQEGLLLSGKDAEADLALLNSLGITHVLQVSALALAYGHCTD